MNGLQSYVTKSTKVYKKGETVKVEGNVITVDNFPSRPDLTRTVDCGFVEVGFTENAAVLTADEFADLIITTKVGTFGPMGPDRWLAGPSYIEIGGWIGDQTVAFQFMALAELHGLGTVLTPAQLGIPESDPTYQQMIGMGFVMLVPSETFQEKLKLAQKKGA